MGIYDRDYMSDDERAGIGRMRGGGGGGGRSPLKIIIGINVAVFVVQYVFGQFIEFAHDGGAVVPQPYGDVSRHSVFAEGRLWGLVTHMFVHGGLLHIALNMVSLYFIGRTLIRAVGERHFVRVYFISGLAGVALHMALYANPVVGASACVFGVLAALGAVMPEERIHILLFFVLPVRVRLGKLAQAAVLVSLIFVVVDLLAPGGIPGNVGHAAHLGGALGGWLYARYSGLGGRAPTLSQLKRQRQKNDRKSERRGLGKVERAKVVSISTGEPLPDAATKKKDPLRAEMDEILDRMNREGRGKPTEEEREVLEKNARELGARSGR